jgi:hypothetical protein
MAAANAAKKALARQREADALNLRLAGATFEAIARQLGLRGPTGAQDCYRRALERLAPIADREEQRRLEAQRLDRLQLPHWQKAINGDAEATQTVLNIMARRARLLGLDAQVSEDLNAILKAIHELRQLPQDDLLTILGYVDQPALPEPDSIEGTFTADGPPLE